MSFPHHSPLPSIAHLDSQDAPEEREDHVRQNECAEKPETRHNGMSPLLDTVLVSLGDEVVVYAPDDPRERDHSAEPEQRFDRTQNPHWFLGLLPAAQKDAHDKVHEGRGDSDDDEADNGVGNRRLR